MHFSGMKCQPPPKKGYLPNDRVDVNKIFVGNELILTLISERASFLSMGLGENAFYW